MLTRLRNWLGKSRSTSGDASAEKTGAHYAARQPGSSATAASASKQPAMETDTVPPPTPEANLIRNKFLREDTGTHETLKILDESIINSGEEEGFDPYNTGDFDRSQNWQRRFRD